MSKTEVAPDVKDVIERNEKGQFPAGVSGNPKGRKKGSKNKITLLKQSLEVQLREQVDPFMPEVMQQIINMALEGDKTMLKLLYESHISKATTNDDAKAAEKVAIQINAAPAAEIKTVNTQDDSNETD